MSFIYAINDKVFNIMSDTKVSINDNLMRLWKDMDSKRIVEQIGMIKTIIVSDSIVIAYAGNTFEGFALLLRRYKGKNIDLEELIQELYNVHIESSEDIEFLVGYYKGKDEKELISIKNGTTIRGCKRAWLGSFDAYKEFARLEKNIPEETYKNIFVTSFDSQGKAYKEPLGEKIAYVHQMNRVFNIVVESGIDSTVGGTVVRVSAMEEDSRWEYMGGIIAVSGYVPQKVEAGENVSFFRGSQDGSYCCNIYQSSRNYCMYIYEDDLGIIFTDEMCYIDGYEGIQFPKLYKISENDFNTIALERGACQCVSLN